MAKERQSNIELLRIIAALGIILIHIGDRGLDTLQFGTVNHSVVFLIESFAHCCVNLFLLASGFFLIKSDRRTLSKPLDLFLQIAIIDVVLFIAFIATNRLDFTLYNVFKYCTPNDYFVVLFVTLYLISPYFNQLLRKLSKKEYRRLLLIMMCIFSIFTISVDVYGEVMGEKWFGLSPIGAWGSQQGFNIVNFILIYIFGGYLSLFGEWDNVSNRKAAFILVLSILIVFTWALLNCFISHQGLQSAWCYHNPFIILMSVSCFILFLKKDIRSKYVNILAKASFLCYIFHTRIVGLIPWGDIMQRNVFVLLLYMLGFCVVAYLISWFLYVTYTFMTKKLFDKINKPLEIKYFDTES